MTSASPSPDAASTPDDGAPCRETPRARVARRYQERVRQSGANAEALGARSRRISNFRGLSFATLVVAGVVSASAEHPTVGAVVACAAALAFGVLVVVHARVLGKEDLAWRHHRVNDNAFKRATHAFSSIPEDGAQFRSDEHPFSGDLDLFGPGSLFQFMNVAHTSYGQASLARFLSSVDEREAIVDRQQAAKELLGRLELRQSLEAYTLARVDPPGQPQAKERPPLDLQRLLEWAEAKPVVSQRLWVVWGARILPVLTLAGILASQIIGLPVVLWAVPLALQLVLSASVSADAAGVFSAVSSSPGAFTRLRPTLHLLEQEAAKAPLLLRLKQVWGSGASSASEQMTRFERVLGWFEIRHNGMLYPFINVAFLWDVHCSVALEAWQAKSGSLLRPWLEALGHWEALSSLAGFAHDNPDFVFPDFVAEASQFSAQGLGHPLIPSGVRVSNDVILEGPGSALLVTGSNMSGKSTLLRAMGLSAVQAMAGTAVCAREMTLSPLSVYTSMRISDSLSAGVSHFYAELKKLRAVLRATDDQPPVFFLLDEILHGTNSEERQVGARWILAELLKAGATGAVSTHDMALCELPTELSRKVRTVHLRESVEGEAMTFDYRLREGPVRGGNALLLMRSLGLSVPLGAGAERPQEI